MSKPYRQNAIDQIERLESAVHYRFATRLLNLATHGQIKITMPRLVEIYGSSQGSVRRALIDLKKSTIIDYHIHDDICYISFCAWPQDGAS